MGRFDHRHTRRLERLAHELWRIDVHDVFETRIEQPVTDGYVMLTDVDLLVRTEAGIVVVEYKSGDDERYATKRYDDALRQLELIGSCFESRLGFRPVAIYAYGARFSYELIDPGSAETGFDLDLISSVLDPSERS